MPGWTSKPFRLRWPWRRQSCASAGPRPQRRPRPAPASATHSTGTERAGQEVGRSENSGNSARSRRVRRLRGGLTVRIVSKAAGVRGLGAVRRVRTVVGVRNGPLRRSPRNKGALPFPRPLSVCLEPLRGRFRGRTRLLASFSSSLTCDSSHCLAVWNSVLAMPRPPTQLPLSPFPFLSAPETEAHRRAGRGGQVVNAQGSFRRKGRPAVPTLVWRYSASEKRRQQQHTWVAAPSLRVFLAGGGDQRLLPLVSVPCWWL